MPKMPSLSSFIPRVTPEEVEKKIKDQAEPAYVVLKETHNPTGSHISKEQFEGFDFDGDGRNDAFVSKYAEKTTSSNLQRVEVGLKDGKGDEDYYTHYTGSQGETFHVRNKRFDGEWVHQSRIQDDVKEDGSIDRKMDTEKFMATATWDQNTMEDQTFLAREQEMNLLLGTPMITNAAGNDVPKESTARTVFELMSQQKNVTSVQVGDRDRDGLIDQVLVREETDYMKRNTVYTDRNNDGKVDHKNEKTKLK